MCKLGRSPCWIKTITSSNVFNKIAKSLNPSIFIRVRFIFCFSIAGFVDMIDRTCSSEASTELKSEDKDIHLVMFDCCKATP